MEISRRCWRGLKENRKRAPHEMVMFLHLIQQFFKCCCQIKHAFMLVWESDFCHFNSETQKCSLHWTFKYRRFEAPWCLTTHFTESVRIPSKCAPARMLKRDQINREEKPNTIGRLWRTSPTTLKVWDHPWMAANCGHLSTRRGVKGPIYITRHTI